MKRTWEINDTLLDLIVGCLIYSLIFEAVGLAAVGNKASWTMGILLGTAASIGLCVSMYKGIDSCLDMDPVHAERSMTVQSIIRFMVMMGAAWMGARFSMISFPAVITGMLGLKVSAHLHMYTHVYITNKLRRKGR